MSIYARIRHNRVVEVWHDGGLNVAPDEVHVPAIAAEFILCPDWVVVGASYDGTTFINPDNAPAAPVLIPITITDVVGDEDGFDNGPNEFTCRQGVAITIHGTLSVPDQKFRVPVAMTDTGRTIVGVADVVAGNLTLTVTFPELGYWQTTEQMLNEGLPQPVFALPQSIRCVVI